MMIQVSGSGSTDKLYGTYFLLLQRGYVSADGAQAGELRVFPDHPLDQLAQRQQKSVPVFRVALQSVSGKKRKNETLENSSGEEKIRPTLRTEKSRDVKKHATPRVDVH